MRHLNKNGQLMMEEEEQLPEELDDVHKQMMMWSAFALAWDEVIDDLRRGDIISDREVAMLKFVRLDLGSRSHGLRPILLPTFFYAVRKLACPLAAFPLIPCLPFFIFPGPNQKGR